MTATVISASHYRAFRACELPKTPTEALAGMKITKNKTRFGTEASVPQSSPQTVREFRAFRATKLPTSPAVALAGVAKTKTKTSKGTEASVPQFDADEAMLDGMPLPEPHVPTLQKKSKQGAVR